MKFSFSSERCFRRCQRQYYFREIAAWHNAKDPLRREAFVLKQLKTIELWRGSLVHRGIERFVVPAMEAGVAVDWGSAADQTVDMARRQFRFSAERKYRQKGLSKAAAGDDYCALLPHERGEAVGDGELAEVEGVVRTAYANLAQIGEFWAGVRGVRRFFAELPLVTDYEGAKVEGHVDLMYFRGFGRPTIVDWKLYEGSGGSDAAHQTALYAWLLCRMPNWRVTDPTQVELLEVQLLGDARLIRHRCDAATLELMEDRLYRGIDDVRSLTGGLAYADVGVEDFGYAASPGTCAFCPFRRLCQNGLQLLGEGVMTRALPLTQLV